MSGGLGRAPRVLLGPADVAARVDAAGGPLAPLAASLTSDLAPLLGREPFIPSEKARMTRVGGRCARDGTLLAFDPFSPRVHRCPLCGTTYFDEAHYRWWIMWYQLWLAERAVHGAALALVVGHAPGAVLARAVLAGYAARYLAYPNQDNVLGPTRPFFSTYLESIWLLQVCVALDLLEAAGEADTLGGTVRDRLIEPSRALVAGYDEGGSNRQVWNAAALAAAARVLGDAAAVERYVLGPHGVAWHLAHGLLDDGTWYEGENYHQFAHRGLWYGVTIAERAGIALAVPLVERFDAGFIAPFLSALPDLTLPARRDSQWRISLRQWRYAESCELGVARRADSRLAGALAALYDPAAPVPSGDTGRSRSAAESERNEPARTLTRADLGWRSLLRASPELPPAERWAPASVLLASQGLAVFRRDAGRLYVALDYGTLGGGHGHPDRLNLLIADRDRRWLDDKGTGSYVERALHWYRSTLAHDAPLVDGRSQTRVDGALAAYAEDGRWGWAEGTAAIAPGVVATRTVVVGPDYVVDRLSWRADRDVTLDLPMHVDAALVDTYGAWRPTTLAGAGGLEDGFDFLRDVEWLDVPPAVAHFRAPIGPRPAGGAPTLDAWVMHDGEPAWYRATAPGAPGQRQARFLFTRRRGAMGAITTVWSLRGEVVSVRQTADGLVVERRDGSDRHGSTAQGWQVAEADGVPITLGGRRALQRPDAPTSPRPPAHEHATLHVPLGSDGVTFALGEAHYRPSELDWADVGRPRARVRVRVVDGALEIAVRAVSPMPRFVAAGATNDLDNERPEINGDSVQLHVRRGDGDVAVWILVPDAADPSRARVIETTPAARGIALLATSARVDDGYEITARVRLAALGADDVTQLDVALDVIVNETAPWRERRRGQLVLSGRHGGFVYLQGDRQDPDRLLRLRVVPAAERSDS